VPGFQYGRKPMFGVSLIMSKRRGSAPLYLFLLSGSRSSESPASARLLLADPNTHRTPQAKGGGAAKAGPKQAGPHGADRKGGRGGGAGRGGGEGEGVDGRGDPRRIRGKENN